MHHRYLGQIEHGQADTRALEGMDQQFLGAGWAVKEQLQLARLIDAQLGGLILIGKGMSTDDDGLLPGRHAARDLVNEDGLTKDGAVQHGTQNAVGTLQQAAVLQAILGNAGRIRRDGGTFDADAMPQDGRARFASHAVLCGITHRQAKVVIVQLDIHKGQDQLQQQPSNKSMCAFNIYKKAYFLLDFLPNKTRHLVAIHFHDGALDVDAWSHATHR